MIDLTVALEKFHQLELEDGDLGAAYWQQVGRLLKRASGIDFVSMQGMADCMHMVHQELIEAEIIPKVTPPMFVTEAVITAFQHASMAANAEAKNADEWRERALALEEDFKRFQACRHGARTMPEDGGEDAFIEAIDRYRVDVVGESNAK